ncbi:MAG: thioredoxin fold domain-containing protein [Proteobacteria bacterium]|nr:thioredoxin fold domain-containing protein [Pseudomonadota bacterium]MBU1389779.1 thioredoxin fold domain-containing protein [Pseudomonadota bacterium]MBU1543788.1 thioredoxin fold domain-containing protein [Pseudomonadota bacterium]MBU2479585.1 thioredoxin fold domain-containing protein [Pseudomonadota bacterium]
MEQKKFQEELKHGITLVDFNAPWCAPCRAQEPIIKKLTMDYQSKARIIEIDIDTHNALATEFRVQSIPTLILFKDNKEIKRFVGLQTEETIVRNLENLL